MCFVIVLQNSLVSGGVLVVHKLNEGKHHYEVEKVLKCKKELGKKMFVRYFYDIFQNVFIMMFYPKILMVWNNDSSVTWS